MRWLPHWGKVIFTDDQLDRSTIKSAARDLQEIRHITDDLRKSLPAESQFKDHLLLVTNPSGAIIPIATSFTGNIKKALIRAGCPVQFNTKKIRKGYSNAIYREVSKNFREYEAKGYHSIETFLNSYHRIQEQDSIDNLSVASETLHSLLRGKPLADEIKIELPEATTQITPAGFCKNETTETLDACSDFNICPLCKYHRLVADPIHVWKSLSHLEIINNILTPTLISVVTPQSPRVAVADIIKMKINASIEQIKSIDPSAVSKGQKLFEKEGIHPDWKIPSNIGVAN